MSAEHPDEPEGETTQRLDKWLWFARLAKTRSLAQRLVLDGKVRVNRERTSKPSLLVRSGDLVTVNLGERVRLLKVASFGTRRGPAPEAAALFEDLAPVPPRTGAPHDSSSAAASNGLPDRDAGTGRPTKRERRQLDKLRGD